MAKPSPAPQVIDADFVSEARALDQMVPEGPPEIAIAGRSNVGKSTLVNRLAARRSLARTSKTPGRTRGIVLYDLSVQVAGAAERVALRFADLPGYGYAQVSQDERRSWQTLVEGYVKRRAALRLFLILVDGRREIADEERQLLEWLVSLGVPHRIVVTKIDKLSAAERGTLGARFSAAAAGTASRVFQVSAQTGEGIDDLWRVMLAHLQTPA